MRGQRNDKTSQNLELSFCRPESNNVPGTEGEARLMAAPGLGTVGFSWLGLAVSQDLPCSGSATQHM